MHHKSHAAHRLLVQFRVVPGASSASYSRTAWVLCLLWHTMILCILCYVVVLRGLRVEGNTINQPSGKWSLCRTMKQCLPMALPTLDPPHTEALRQKLGGNRLRYAAASSLVLLQPKLAGM